MDAIFLSRLGMEDELMSLRFRRRVRLAPGVHLNFGTSGVSLSLGPRGASITLGKNGVCQNVGLPGTGLYSRKKIAGPYTTSQRSESPGKVEFAVSVGVTDDGVVEFTDSDGQPLDETIVREVRKQQGAAIRQLMDEYAEGINQAVSSNCVFEIG